MVGRPRRPGFPIGATVMVAVHPTPRTAIVVSQMYSVIEGCWLVNLRFLDGEPDAPLFQTDEWHIDLN